MNLSSVSCYNYFQDKVIEKYSETSEIYIKVITLLKEARGTVVRTVNQTMVLTYYEIGRIIVEEEQKGQNKAQYGTAVISELSKKLSKEFGKGFSKTNIKQMRAFLYAIKNVRHCLTFLN